MRSCMEGVPMSPVRSWAGLQTQKPIWDHQNHLAIHRLGAKEVTKVLYYFTVSFG